MSPAWVAALGQRGGGCVRAASAMLAAYAVSYATTHANIDPLLHDACPVARLLQPELFRGEPWTLEVICQKASA